MYTKILVALDNSKTDRFLIPEAAMLARVFGAQLLLVHVADGWVARNFDQLQLAESDEMREDRAYLEEIASGLRKEDLRVATHLALGDPAEGILKTAEDQHCDLIALVSHGHRLIGDIVHGDCIEKVRHRTTIPLFIASSRK